MALPELKQTDADGLMLAWREAGTGAPIIFLHGIGSGSAGWEAQLDHFSQGYRAIAWDAPGYGGSGDLAPEAPDAGDYAAALGKLMDALGLERAHLVGNSLGSLMAGAFVRRSRGRVLSLVLSDPAIGHGKADPKVREESLQGRLDGVYKHGPERMAAERATKLMGSSGGDAAIAKVRAVMSQVRPDGYAQAARMLAMGNLLAELEGCDAPTLVITGGEDIVTPPKGGRKVADTCMNGRFELIEKVGHLPYVEVPETFNRLVEDFLAEQDRAAA